MNTLTIQLFGNLRIHREGQPVTAVNTNRLHSLLAWLILEGDTPQPRERLAAVLWPESSASQARTNLRQLLHHLKRALPADCTSLNADHFAVHWCQDGSCTVDALQFQQAIALAGRSEAELEHLIEAARLYEDDLLPSLFDDWLTPVRDSYRKQLSTVLNRIAEIHETKHEYADAIPYAERLVAHDSLSEANYQLLIGLHAANQDRSSALRAYHQCMTVLRRELGVQPGPATVALFERVLKQTPQATAKPAAQQKTVRFLIGRGAERQRLQWAWESVTTDGPRAVIISGEPGIGKTRLAEELLQHHNVARARCYSGQGQVPYAPISEWLRAVNAQWPAVESSRRLQLYESLNALFRKSPKPLLLFIDDLQWCDSDSLEWLQSFLLSPSAAGTMLLGTVRSEETGRDHPFTRFAATLRQAGISLELPLTPLNAADTIDLARQESAEPLAPAKLTEIVQSTKGNPLFVLESVRAGVESTRVHGVIAARLAKLSPTSYELAGLASVVGRPFSFELLERASDWDERSLSGALDELWQRRIIESRGTAEYDFTHDRLREVTHSELSLVRLRYLHRRVARALNDVHHNDPGDWDGQVAAHYEQAGMPEQAIKHYHLAADYARQRYAYTESAILLRVALTLCRQLPESAKWLEQELNLLVTLGPAIAATEGYSAPEVGANYERALELSRRLGNRDLFVILSGSWVFHVVRGDLEKSRQLALEFLKAAHANPAPGLLRAGNFILGSSLFHLGRLEESLQRMQTAMADPSDLNDSVLALFASPNITVFCRSYMAHLFWHRGIQGADLQNAEAISSATRTRHPFSQAIALVYAAMLRVFEGDREAALIAGRKAVDLCAQNGFSYYLAVANILTGWAAEAGGIPQLRDGIEAMRRLGAEIRLPYYYALLAETYRRAGLPREAAASLSTGFAFLSKNGEDWSAAELYRVQGDLLPGDARLLSYARALEAARRCGSLAFEAKPQLLDGTPIPALAERS